MSHRRIASNAAFLAAARGGTMLLKLGVAAHLTRVLAPEGFGVLGFGMALVSYAGLLGTLGLDVLGTREAARRPEAAGLLVERVVGLRLALASGALALYGGLVAALPLGGTVRFVLLAQGAVILVQALDVEWLYRGLERMRPVAVRNVAADAVQLAGVLLFVREPEHLLRAAWIASAAAAVVAGGMWWSYRRDFGPLRPRADRAAWGSLLRPALPLTASALMVAVYYSSDRLMLGWLRGPEDVGHYEAAYRLMGVAVAASQILSQAFFPSLVTADGGPAGRGARGRSFATASAAVGLPIAALVAVSAGPLTVWFAGPAFAPAAQPLAILMASAAAVYVNVVLGQSLLAWDAHRPYVAAVTVGAVINVALNLVVIPTYGTAGAAWATLAAELSAMGVVAAAYRRLTGGLPVGPVVRGGAGAVAAALPAWALLQGGFPLWSALAVGLAGALAATVAVGTLRPRHLRAWAGRSSSPRR